MFNTKVVGAANALAAGWVSALRRFEFRGFDEPGDQGTAAHFHDCIDRCMQSNRDLQAHLQKFTALDSASSSHSTGVAAGLC